MLGATVRDAVVSGRAASPNAAWRAPSVGRVEFDRFLTDLVEDRVHIEAIVLPGRSSDVRRHFAALVEPAARRFGDLWTEDALSEFEVTIALGRLQLLVRHLALTQGEAVLRPHAPAVLVATMPGEPHALGAVLDSEWLWLSGWTHAFDVAATDLALQQSLHAGRFDVLDLSLSPAFHGLAGAGMLRRRLGAFRAASCNPALRIRLSGRLFAKQPWLAALVGADAVGGTCQGLDAQLLRMVEGLAFD